MVTSVILAVTHLAAVALGWFLKGKFGAQAAADLSKATAAVDAAKKVL